MRWFGPPHPHLQTMPVPTHRACEWCEELIAAGDTGVELPCLDVGTVVFHEECFMRSVLGSVGHQLQLCSCFGGDLQHEDDDPNITRREAARAAWDLAIARRHAFQPDANGECVICDEPADDPRHPDD